MPLLTPRFESYYAKALKRKKKGGPEAVVEYLAARIPSDLNQVKEAQIPAYIECVRLYAVSLTESGDPLAACALLQSVLEWKPDALDVLGRTMVGFLNAALRSHPKGSGGGEKLLGFLRFLTGAYLAAGWYKECMDLSKASLSVFPDSGRLSETLADALIGLGRLAEAVAVLREAIDVAPDICPSILERAEILFEALQSGEKTAAGLARALLGRTLYETQRHAESLRHLATARDLLGEQFAETTTLLHAYAITDVDGFLAYVGELAESDAPAHIITAMTADCVTLLSKQPNSGPLKMLMGVCQFRAGHQEEAARYLDEAMALAPDLLEAIIEWHEKLGTAETGNPGIRLSLAMALHAVGREPESFALFSEAVSAICTPEKMEAVCGVLQDTLESEPQKIDRQQFLIRTLLRRGLLNEAIEQGRSLLSKEPDGLPLAVDVCDDVLREAHKPSTKEKALAKALRFVAECSAQTADMNGLTSCLAELITLKKVSKKVLRWGSNSLKKGLDANPDHLHARLTLAAILAQMGSALAIKEYAHLVSESTPADLLQTVVKRLLPLHRECGQGQDTSDLLARAHVLLKQPDKARMFVMSCIEDEGRREAILDFLTKKASDSDHLAGLRKLLVEADVASASESRMAEAIDYMDRFREGSAPEWSFLVEQCRRILEQSEDQGSRRRACCMKLQALLRIGEFEDLAEECRFLTQEDTDVLDYASDCVTQAMDRVEDHRISSLLLLARGHISALRGGEDIDPAVRDLRLAAEMDVATVGEAVIEECERLREAEMAGVSAALVACHVALQMGHGSASMGEMLQVVNRCTEEQARQARSLAERVREQDADCGESLLVIGRTAVQLGDLPGAIEAYGQLLQTGASDLVAQTAEDLAVLVAEHEGNVSLCLLLADVQIASGDIEATRNLLLRRIEAVPEDAPECVSRLKNLADRPEANWADWLALGMAGVRTGAQEDAVAWLRKAVEDEDIDSSLLAEIVREFCAGRPDDPVSAILAISTDIRSLPPKEVKGPMERMEALVSGEGPIPGPNGLAWLLAECMTAQERAGNVDEMALLVQCNRARVLIRTGMPVDAARMMVDVLRSWPDAHEKVAEICRQGIDTSDHPAYQLPLAAVHALEGPVEDAMNALRELVDADDAFIVSAVDVCELISDSRDPPERTEALLLGAKLRAQAGGMDECASLYLSALEEDSALIDRVVSELDAIVAEHPDQKGLYIALGRAQLARGEAGIPSATETMRRLMQAQPEGAIDAAVEFLESVREKWPKQSYIQHELLRVRFHQGPDAYPAIAEDIHTLCQDFGDEGCEMASEFLAGVLTDDPAHVPLWYARSQIYADTGDLLGALSALNTVKRIALDREADSIRAHAEGLHDAEDPAGPVLTFLAELAGETGDNPECARLYSQAVELPDSNLEVIHRGLSELLERTPEDLATLWALARCEELEGNADGAALCYRRAADLGEAAKAEEYLCELRDSFPEAIGPSLALGQCQLMQGRFAEATESLTAATTAETATDDQRSTAYKCLSECHVRLADIGEAVECLKQACRLAPEDDDTARRLLRLHFESQLLEIERIKKNIAKNGETPSRVLKLGKALKDYGEYAEASRWLQRASASASTRNQGLLTLGQCQMALNHCNLATVSFRKVLDDEKDPKLRKEALYQLGTAYSRLLDFEKAAEAFGELCAIDCDYGDAMARLAAVHRNESSTETFLMAEIPFDLVTTWRQLVQRSKDTDPDQRESLDDA